MNQSEQINELASALIKVQANLKPVPKDSENPFFHSHYADLTSIWETIRKPLTDNGLCVVQTNSGNTCESITVDTMLLHTSGQWIKGSLTLKASKIKMSKQNPSQVESEIIDPQSMGSALTYARRYALAAIVGVCPEDDDAEGAMDRKEAPKTNGKVYPTPRIDSAPKVHPHHQDSRDRDLVISHFMDVLEAHISEFGENNWKKYMTGKDGTSPSLDKIKKFFSIPQINWLVKATEKMSNEIAKNNPDSILNDEPLIPNVND